MYKRNKYRPVPRCLARLQIFASPPSWDLKKKKISNQIKEYKSAAALGGAEEAEVPARGGQRRLAAAELDLVDSWTARLESSARHENATCNLPDNQTRRASAQKGSCLQTGARRRSQEKGATEQNCWREGDAEGRRSARTPRRRSAAGRRTSARALGRLLCAVRTGARAGVGMLVNKWGWTGWPMGSIIFMCLWAKFNHYVAVGSMCFCPQGWKTKLGTISGSCVGVFNYTNT